MIMGLVVVAILAPEAKSSTALPAVAERPLLPHKRPAICPDAGKVGNADRAQRLYDEARAGLQAGAQLSEVRRKVEESLRENPFSAEGYYLYGQVLRDPKDAELARQTYACTCFVSSGSPECREVKNKKLAQ
jgi:hypothetical protein